MCEDCELYTECLVGREGDNFPVLQNMGGYMETRQRTFVKSVLWTALGLVVMAGVGFVFTGSLRTGGGMAVINAAIGFITYLLYERLWARIPWGLHV